VTPTDRHALEHAIVVCRALDAIRAKQIDQMLASEQWEQVAQFAAYCAQIEALQLAPWMSPPCYPDMRALNQPYGDVGASVKVPSWRCGCDATASRAGIRTRSASASASKQRRSVRPRSEAAMVSLWRSEPRGEPLE
jgi:hypothetical protein